MCVSLDAILKAEKFVTNGFDFRDFFENRVLEIRIRIDPRFAKVLWPTGCG